MYRHYRRQNYKRYVIGGYLREGAVKLFGHIPRKIMKKLDEYGNSVPTNIRVARAPVQSIIKNVLNLLSFNALQKWMERKNFDDIFHLSILFDTSDGKTHRLEKNQIVTWDDYKPREDEQILELGHSPENLSLREIFYRTQDRIGKDNMWLYSAFGNRNCQNFIMESLKSMELWSGQAPEFVFQDVTDLVQEINPLTEKVAQETTDYAGAFSSLLDRFGFKKGGVLLEKEPTRKRYMLIK